MHTNTHRFTDANNLRFVRNDVTFTLLFCHQWPFITNRWQSVLVTLCWVFKLICRALMYAKWDLCNIKGEGEEMKKCRDDRQKKVRRGRERSKKISRRWQGSWLVKGFALSTCYAFCPWEIKALWCFNISHEEVHLPQCLVSFCPPVTLYVRSASILHKG